MGIFKKIIGTIFEEETEEQKLDRLKNEELVKNQSNLINNMKCPICGNTKFNKGYISSSGPYGGAIAKISTYHEGYNKEYKEIVMVCANCGHVQIFANFESKQIVKL